MIYFRFRVNIFPFSISFLYIWYCKINITIFYFNFIFIVFAPFWKFWSYVRKNFNSSWIENRFFWILRFNRYLRRRSRPNFVIGNSFRIWLLYKLINNLWMNRLTISIFENILRNIPLSKTINFSLWSDISNF
mgnify:CR=1 FL=1